MSQSCDIIIAGGGMIGASLACALEGLGLDVVVVEAASAPDSATSAAALDERTTALAPVTQRILQTLELWPALAPEAEAIRRIHISRRGGAGVTRLDAARDNLPALGYVVSNQVLGAALFRRLKAAGGVEVIYQARLCELVRSGGGVRVTLATDAGTRTLESRLLVAADGAASRCRRLLGIGASRHDYGHSALVTNLALRQPHGGLAYERFTPDGPMALLPMTRGLAALVLTLPQPEVDHWLECSDEALVAEVDRRLGGRLGEVESVGARQTWPLSLVRASRLTAEHGVVIGNAAHTLHPVAGQGFNLGMRDVAVLAEAIAAAPALETGDWLRAYARQRQADHQRLVGFSHGLVQLFGRHSPVPSPLLDAGLLGLDLCGPGKRGFARAAMGLGPGLPRLARGLPLREGVLS